MRDHRWYDSESGKMLYGRGGRMEFVYNPQTKKSRPRIVDQEEWVTENSYDNILKWVKQQNLKIVHEAPKLYMTINVTPLEWNALEEMLYHNDIAYDYDERELRKESQMEGNGWQNSILKSQIRLTY